MLRDEYETKFVPRAQYEIVRLALLQLLEGSESDPNVSEAWAALRKAEAMEI
jgi:hypothetical protein